MVRRGSGAAKWRAVLKECAASGLSQVEFARQRRIRRFGLNDGETSRVPNGADRAINSTGGRLCRRTCRVFKTSYRSGTSSRARVFQIE